MKNEAATLHPGVYLMEAPDEGLRLRMKTDERSTASQLRETGFDDLPDGARILDAGAGVGVVSKVMAELLRQSGKSADLFLVDRSSDRLAQAKALLGDQPPVRFHYSHEQLESLSLENDFLDYCFSRFVFEYLPDPEKAFDALLAKVKPGGKLVIGDLDGNCLNHYPIEADLEMQLQAIVRCLHDLKVFDPFMGRKIFHMFHQRGLRDIRVHFHAHHLFYGDLRNIDEFNWEAKLDRLIDLQKQNRIFEFDLDRFKTRFLTFLKRRDRFTYSPLILVEGVKPDNE